MQFSGCVIVFVLLICLQTTLLSNFSGLFSLYDLLIPAVVYLTLFRPSKAECSAIIVAGLVMDLLSEAPMGSYLITYIVIFLVFQNSKKYFHFRNLGLFQIVSIIGIFMEHCVFGVFKLMKTMTVDISFYALQIVLTQTAWAVVTIPFIYIILNSGFKGFDHLIIKGFKPSV
ncbi:MAG: rod shape-determining protein MreD [Desulfobacteraceae bacterium]|nr:MAG: rod shape-determining protein MreD [Desulfobacteraceae bacterium]